MKREIEKVPRFDDIIFENRNKKYGAYDLRKRYNSSISISILGTVVFVTILTIVLSLLTEEGNASTGPKSVIIVMSDPIVTESVPLQVIKPPQQTINVIKNFQPEVVSDTSLSDNFIPITEVIIENVQDGTVNEEVVIIENPDPVEPEVTNPFIVVEEPPEFPGGMAALMKFISDEIIYPSDAQNNNIQGKVILKFVVTADGATDRIEVIGSVDPLLDNEAVRVIEMLPRFKPGKQGGVPVPVWFSIPVIFRIANN